MERTETSTSTCASEDLETDQTRQQVGGTGQATLPPNMKLHWKQPEPGKAKLLKTKKSTNFQEV